MANPLPYSWVKSEELKKKPGYKPTPLPIMSAKRDKNGMAWGESTSTYVKIPEGPGGVYTNQRAVRCTPEELAAVVKERNEKWKEWYDFRKRINDEIDEMRDQHNSHIMEIRRLVALGKLR